ncbi:MAG TPA: hypothetical protein VF733_02240 [Candidatus Saccharimonadales bacterium]
MLQNLNGALIEHGLDIYRPVEQTDALRILGRLSHYASSTAITLRHPDDPKRCPAINFVPRQWYRGDVFAADMSLQTAMECIYDEQPNLTNAQIISVSYSLTKPTRHGHRFIVAQPHKESLVQISEEQRGVRLGISEALAESDGKEPWERPWDITLAHVKCTGDDPLLYTLKDMVANLPAHEEITLSGLVIKPSMQPEATHRY